MIFNTFYDAFLYAQTMHISHKMSFTVFEKHLIGYSVFYTIRQTCEAIKDDFWCYCGKAICSTITCV